MLSIPVMRQWYGVCRGSDIAPPRGSGAAKIPVSKKPMRRRTDARPAPDPDTETRPHPGGRLRGLLVQATARADDTNSSDPEVRVTTNMGSFVVELYPDRAPLTVANFLRYVREGFYTNTLFHRVVANFVIQGGGHEANPPYDLKPTYPSIDNESGNGLQNKRGAVGLARAAGPHTGNAQFYVNLVDNPELDPLPTRWGYTVFGQVVEGMDVVDRIGVVPTGSFRPLQGGFAAEAA